MELALHILGLAVISAMLIWGCITDYKIREVSNWASVAIFTAAFLIPCPWTYRWISLGVMIVTFVLGSFFGIRHGMGDVKMILSLTFAIGMFSTMVSLVLGGLLAFVYGIIKKLPANRRVPLVTYLCFGYHICLIASIWLHCSGVIHPALREVIYF